MAQPRIDPSASDPKLSAAEQIDKDLANRALKKRLEGKQPTREELAALRRWELAREERQRWLYYESIPQKHWLRMSGRPAKVVNEQAARYGVPVGGAVLSLAAIARGIHDFFQRHARILASPKADDPLLLGENSPALERYREAKADMAEMDRDQQRGNLLPRDEIHELLARVASVLRGTGEKLRRQHGEGAHALMDEGLDGAERAIEEYFAAKAALEVGRVEGVRESGSVSDRPPGRRRREISPGPEGA